LLGSVPDLKESRFPTRKKPDVNIAWRQFNVGLSDQGRRAAAGPDVGFSAPDDKMQCVIKMKCGGDQTSRTVAKVI
jgi:hypothetical protein